MYREFCSRVGSRSGNYLPESLIAELTAKKRCKGFSSLYAFNAQDVLPYRYAQTSSLTKFYEVFSDYILIDVDTGDKDIIEILSKIEGYQYDLATSGGKGYHIYLYHQPISHVALPYSQKIWVQINFGELVDTCIYEQNRIVANYGRLHHRTGRPKMLLRKQTGKRLELPIVEGFDASEKRIEPMELSDVYLKMMEVTQISPSIGNRHMSLWLIGKGLYSNDYSKNAIFEILSNLNSNFEHPKSEQEVVQIVRQL